MFCDQCGKQMPDGSLFCPNCGAKNALGTPVREPIKPFSETVKEPVKEPIKPFSEIDSKPVKEPIKPFSETVNEPVREPIKPFSEAVPTPVVSPEPVVVHTPDVAPTPAVELAKTKPESKNDKKEKAKMENVTPVSVSYETDILYKPISVLGFIGIFLLMCIPLVNLILLFVWAFSKDTNKNKKNFAIASLIMILISIVLSIVFSVVFGAAMFEIFEYMNY